MTTGRKLRIWRLLDEAAWAFCVLAAVSTLALLLMHPSASARDLGAIGPVHEITEPHMIEDIKARLRVKQASGELARIDAEAKKRILASIEAPPPVPGLTPARQARSWHFDPSVRFDVPVLDHQGRVVIPAGMLANPLSVVSLRSTLLFFDARDPKQVALARAELKAAKGPIKPILVGGSPTALIRAWQRPVYFDQFGVMVRRFGITSVPARVTQDGALLLIQELPT